MAAGQVSGCGSTRDSRLPMPDNRSHNHHFLPCFYTKRWARLSDGKVCVYYRHQPYLDVMPRWKHPSAFGYEVELNTIKRTDGTLDASLETEVFAPLDNRASEAVKHLIELPGKSLTPSARSDFTRLLLSFLHRLPHRIERYKERLASDVEHGLEELREAYADGEDIGLPAGVTLDEAIVSIRAKSVNESWAPLVASMMNSKITGNHILNMLWFVREIKHTDLTLLTSDCPFVHYNGIGQPQGNIALALGPKHLFFAANSVDVVQNISFAPDSFLVRRFNHEVVRQAVKIVCSNNQSEKKFVAQRMNREPPLPPLRPGKSIKPVNQWFIK